MHTVGTAGVSAALEARRRRRRQRAGRVLALVAVLGGVGVVVAGSASAVSVAAGVALGVVGAWAGRSRGAGRWAAGAAGEWETATALEAIGGRWTVLHDLGVPGTRANIDHIAVGPSGVVVIDSKRWAGVVRVGRGHVRVDRRRRPEVIERQHWYAETVERVLDDAGFEWVPVRSMIVVHGARIRRGVLRRSAVAGVRIVATGDLVRAVARGRRRVSARLVPQVVDALRDGLGGRLR